MRIGRAGAPGEEKPVVGTGDDRWYDAAPVVDDWHGDTLSSTDAVAAALSRGELTELPAPTRFGAPLARVGKIVCVGLNYRDHAAETGAAAPAEPILFLKTPDTVVGAYDEVLVPRRSVKTDYEVELAVVIGRPARYLDRVDDGLDVVAGYAVSNDVSEREFQTERGGQWDKGKNCETFNPLGPWNTTTDDVPDSQDLALRTWVNGALRQDGSTADMIFGVAHLVWYVSQFMVLRPGDVINTGTPAGVAMGVNDFTYLREGDVMELEIDGLGRQRQTVGQA